MRREPSSASIGFGQVDRPNASAPRLRSTCATGSPPVFSLEADAGQNLTCESHGCLNSRRRSVHKAINQRARGEHPLEGARGCGDSCVQDDGGRFSIEMLLRCNHRRSTRNWGSALASLSKSRSQLTRVISWVSATAAIQMSFSVICSAEAGQSSLQRSGGMLFTFPW